MTRDAELRWHLGRGQQPFHVGADGGRNAVRPVAQVGLELLAFGGRFVEIGKRDIYGDTHLGLFPFRRNLSLYAVDLALMTHSHPETVQQLLTTVYERTADGTLPMPETTHYPMSDATKTRLNDPLLRATISPDSWACGTLPASSSRYSSAPAIGRPTVPIFRS